MSSVEKSSIKVIIGLGNPGKQYQHTRHNIGFLVVDALADKYNGSWQKKGDKEVAEIMINDHEKIMLVKPQTFMNSSGKVLPSLLKQGITGAHIIVVHDELEKPFGVVDYKYGGSHRGHNGLRSIIEIGGADFNRVRCGIGRPVHKEDVPDYVLSTFSESQLDVDAMIQKAVSIIDERIGGLL